MLVLEAAYAEMTITGRNQLPAPYVEADQRLQDLNDYMDEVREMSLAEGFQGLDSRWVRM
jgi:hypothetical protein